MRKIKWGHWNAESGIDAKRCHGPLELIWNCRKEHKQNFSYCLQVSQILSDIDGIDYKTIEFYFF